MRPVAAAVLLVVLPTIAAIAGQARAESQARQLSRFERLERWLAAVAQHQPGTLDATSIEIASWPDEHLTAVVDDVGELAAFLLRAQVRRKRSGQSSAPAHHHGRTLSLDELQRLLGVSDDEMGRGDVSRLAIRAALLHTDITCRLDEYDPLIPPRPLSSARTALLVTDGRNEGVADRGPHWDLARSLLNLVAPDSRRLEQKRHWYLAAAAFMHSRGRLADLLPHIARASQLFPADADILSYGGALHETLASPSVQQAVRTLGAPGAPRAGVSDAPIHLRHAQAFFERALASDPGHLEGRVRLGHVLVALGDDAKAAGELRRALTRGGDWTLDYYAALLLGGIHARAGRRDEARALYERAASLYPRAQSPRMGLSSLARASGDKAAAAKALLPWLPASHVDDFQDPWWFYFSTRMDRADQLLDAWRGSVEPWADR